VSSGARLYPDRPILGALAVVRRDGRVLLAQRSVPPSIGKWGFPGGKQELGETVRECARRELLEETGVSAAPVAELSVLDMIRHDEAGRVMTHFTLVCVLMDWQAGEGEPIEDALAIRWVTVAQAEALETFPAAVPMLRLALDYVTS
jgi:8-oxo-dGTP diphosphatase